MRDRTTGTVPSYPLAALTFVDHKAKCALQAYLTAISLWDAPQDEPRHGDGSTARTDGELSIGADGTPAIRVDCRHADEDFEFRLDVLIGGLRERVAAMPTAT